MRPYVAGVVVMDSVLAAAGCENPRGTTDQANLAERFTPHVWHADLDSYDPMAAEDGAELRWAQAGGCGDDPITAEVDQRMLAGGEYRHKGSRPDREPTGAWTQHHCSEPDQLPATMRGEWRSPRPADGPSSDKTYYVHLTLTGVAVDTDVSKVDYPDLECGGSLTLLAVEPDTVTLTETISDDSGEVSC
jgi:hypothetical protein